MIIEILVLFFRKRNYHGIVAASTEFACANSLSGIVFASIAFVMTTALVMGVTPLRPPAKEALTVPNGYKKIEVYFPDAEYEAFLKKVKRTNLSISAFVRKMAAEQVIREAPHADVPYLMREVKRVGNNINQLLFLANSKGFFDKAALTNALKELREVDKLIFDVFSKANTLPHIHPHAFRHTAASTMILNGVDMVSAAAELGHASRSTTANIYAHQFAIARAKAASVRAGVFANRK